MGKQHLQLQLVILFPSNNQNRAVTAHVTSTLHTTVTNPLELTVPPMAQFNMQSTLRVVSSSV